LHDPVQGKALTSITVGNGGFGLEAFRQRLGRGTEAVGSPPTGINDDPLQGVLGLKPLPDEVPEGDEGGPKPFIKAFRRLEAGQSHDTTEGLEGLG
jgi:hypothetical protein